jgi:hypothetical protein
MIKDNNLELKIKFLEYYSEVPIKKYASAWIGRSEDTTARWEADDTDFADQIEITKAEYLKKKLIKVQSPEWIIERLFKDHFSSRQEITGANGKDLLPEVIEDLNNNVNLAGRIKKITDGQGVAADPSIQNQG